MRRQLTPALLLLACADEAACVAPRLRAPRMSALEPSPLGSAFSLPTDDGRAGLRGPLMIPSAAKLAHGCFLPRAMTAALVSPREKLVLGFLLEFIHAQGLDAPLLLSGGYVRDLLLGADPEDMDVSICLRGCSEGVTIASLTAELPRCAARSAPA